jgi:hypothetical protein
MLDALSLPGLVGAAVGIFIGYLNYGVFLKIVVGKLHEAGARLSGAERSEHERKIVLLRRIVLVADIAIFAVLGYVFGRTIAGYGLS